jgi:hypothetical protein
VRDPLQKNKPRENYIERPAGKPGAKKLPTKQKRIQTTVSIQRALMEAVDAAAEEHGVTRSMEIQMLVTEALEARLQAIDNPDNIPDMIRRV